MILSHKCSIVVPKLSCNKVPSLAWDECQMYLSGGGWLWTPTPAPLVDLKWYGRPITHSARSRRSYEKNRELWTVWAVWKKGLTGNIQTWGTVYHINYSALLFFLPLRKYKCRKRLLYECVILGNQWSTCITITTFVWLQSLIKIILSLNTALKLIKNNHSWYFDIWYSKRGKKVVV